MCDGSQNVFNPWTHYVASQYVDKCHIDKFWPTQRHATHVNNNVAHFSKYWNQGMKFHTCSKWFMLSGSKCGYGLVNSLNKPMSIKETQNFVKNYKVNQNSCQPPIVSDMSKPFGFQQPLEVPNLFSISLDQVPIMMK